MLFDHGSYVPQVSWLSGFKGDGLPMGSPVVAFLAKIQSLLLMGRHTFSGQDPFKKMSQTLPKKAQQAHSKRGI